MPESSTINMFWHGTALSGIEEICIQSFLDRGYAVRLFTYTDIEMPAGVIPEDARSILPYDRLFFYDESPSAFSNIFRYKLLWERGGWWVDTDVLMLKAEMPDCDYYWAEEDPGRINGAVLKFPARDPLSLVLLKMSEERSTNIKRWGYLGPELLTEILGGRTFARHCGSTNDVYPLHWREAHFLWLPELCDEAECRLRNATFVHLWNSVLHSMRITSNNNPPPGSYLHNLYRNYGLNFQIELDVVSCRHFVERFLRRYPIVTRIQSDPQARSGEGSSGQSREETNY